MKATWLTLNERFSALSLREKVMILACGLVVLTLIVYSLVLDPAMTSWSNGQKSQRTLERQFTELQQQQELLTKRLRTDPNISLRQQIKQHQQEITELDEKLRVKSVDLISASQMAATLREILGNTKKIKLIHLESIAPSGMLLQEEDAPAIDGKLAEAINLYQHGVKITLEGKYFDILNFFKSIEALPTRLFWKKLDYRVTDYPLAEVEFEIYTLSTGKDFISV